MIKLINFIKARFLDIALIAVIFAVFFISGTQRETSDLQTLPEAVNESLQGIPAVQPKEQAGHAKQAGHAETSKALATATQEFPLKSFAVASPYLSSSPAVLPSPFPSISYKTELDPALRPAENLQESFRALEGGSVSTEAIIERNTYFRKLSEQLKDLQGDVSTESSGREVNLPSQNNPVPGDPLQPELLTDEELLNDPESLDELYNEIEQFE